MVAYLNPIYNSTVTNATTTNIWGQWCNIGTTTTTSATTVWCNWVSNTSTSAATVVTDVWPMWMDSQGNIYAQVNPAAQPLRVQQNAPTEAQVREAQERQALQAAAYREQEQQRKVAAAKALELLRANISQKQREALDKHGWFLVEGGKSKKTYRIYGDRSAGNIFELGDDKKKEVMRYCVHASYEIPLGDQLLAQAISLRLDEDHIIGKANKTQLAA